MAKKYFAKLKRIWEQKRKTKPLKPILKFPFGRNLQRPKALRGPDLVQELARLAALTWDARFTDAVFALIHHRIVDEKFNFLPWAPRLLVQENEKLELMMCGSIHALKSRCRLSLRRACAEFAARTGWEAASFAAATKDLELLYRRHFDVPKTRKFMIQAAVVAPADLVALVEKMCSTDYRNYMPPTPKLELEKILQHKYSNDSR